MKFTHSKFKPSRHIAAIMGLVILTTGALATANGSTDIYRNEFPHSFGPATILASRPVPGYRGGSTDIYGNQFSQSFGPASSGLAATRLVCTGGSTDIYSNQFQKNLATEQATRLARCP
jgi:hypothetical protein